MTGLDPRSRQQVLVAVVQDEGRAVKTAGGRSPVRNLLRHSAHQTSE